MVNDTEEIMLDILRSIRADISDIKSKVSDLKEGQLALRGDMLRNERGIASLEIDIDRIKQRLDLVD